ncbi:MAG: bifunctional pyr operon transcriptional regulator/uracil phosphoribosyltransferase PyrR [Oscillospiraceae bacterium]|nr:bifunctional pyr operon transcriptional regulator/uracil phosphoribosyltransferase PyrR [Oscillospiraceae bacterium]
MGGVNNTGAVKAVIMDENAISRAIARISYEILERNKGSESLCIVAIMSGGSNIAERIAAKINELESVDIPVGALDITSYRDDEKHIPDCDKTSVSFDVTGKRIILVDDVIFTGRSARAAIDALMKRGRPECIQLAVLVDRGHREIPIRPDYVGKNLPTSRDESVKVLINAENESDRVVILE